MIGRAPTLFQEENKYLSSQFTLGYNKFKQIVI
jgi:hypothetical protein